MYGSVPAGLGAFYAIHQETDRAYCTVYVAGNGLHTQVVISLKRY